MNTRSELDSSIVRDGATGLSKGTYEALLSDGAGVSAAVMLLRPGTGAGAAVAVLLLLDMVAVAVGFCAVSGC